MQNAATSSPFNTVSPLVLSHHLLALAEDADRAGLRRSASRILELALTVCSDVAPSSMMRGDSA